jgi:hypothetical protein
MRQFVIEPQTKKSVVEMQTFTKKINGVQHYLRYEDCFRWGGFILGVPDTPEELESWAEDQGYDTFAEWAEDHEFDIETDDIAEYALPDAENDEVMLNEDYGWDVEMIETWDGGCWTEWNIYAYGEGALSEEEREEEAERLSEIYYEEYEEGLEEQGWEYVDNDYVLYNGIKITEVPEGESAYDLYNG